LTEIFRVGIMRKKFGLHKTCCKIVVVVGQALPD